MRSTVIVTELVLAGAVFALSRPARTDRKTVEEQGEAATRRTLAASLLMHPGLLIVDHIHFQYNGFLFGVLAWALWAAREVSASDWRNKHCRGEAMWCRSDQFEWQSRAAGVARRSEPLELRC